MARLAWVAVALLLCLLALARPIDHDESQYVAAAVLTAHGALPYRDYAYLQTPLQPFLFAPLAWAAGTWAWPALRLANALCGAVTLWTTWRAARLLAPARVALAAVALFACCDVFLFSVGTARNDALPAACLAGALWLAVRAEQDGASRGRAALAGLLLAAAAAKVSYALPAVAYGLWALMHRRHRPVFVALGAAPMLLFVGWTYALAPDGFVFGVWTFPTKAPLDWYADRPWKLSLAAKLLDMLKFLALGPALLALAVAVRRRAPPMLVLLLAAGAIAALLPTPTWRQYLLPLLPPLFVLLAHRWAAAPPSRAQRIVAVTLATAGLAPTVLALASGRPAMVDAMRDGAAIRRTMDAAGIADRPVATLSPQFLPATGRLPDARFATGPFVFRGRGLALPASATDLRVVQQGFIACALLPPAVLVGGESDWTSGDDRLDRVLERAVVTRGYRRVGVPGTPFRLYVRAAITP